MSQNKENEKHELSGLPDCILKKKRREEISVMKHNRKKENMHVDKKKEWK